MKKLLLIATTLFSVVGFTAETKSNSLFSSLENPHPNYSWMFNVGTSRMADINGYDYSASGITASALYSFKNFSNRLSAGLGFSHYDYQNYGGNFQFISALGEFRVIQADLYGNTKLFSSLTTGLNYGMNDGSGSRSTFNYGVALGVQFNEQIGMRFDIKSGRNITTASGLSLVGYY